jgi:hypothetical protein
MSERLTLELPDPVARQARALAAATHRRFEDALVDWISQAVNGPAVELLPEEDILRLCELQLPPTSQAVLSDLLAKQREGDLPEDDARRLDELMAEYRQGMLLKARAWREAVHRGLKEPLSDHAA